MLPKINHTVVVDASLKELGQSASSLQLSHHLLLITTFLWLNVTLGMHSQRQGWHASQSNRLCSSSPLSIANVVFGGVIYYPATSSV